MVRGRVHGVVVVCEVRVGAGLVVRGRVDRAVPCAPLLEEVGDAAGTWCSRVEVRSRGLPDELADPAGPGRLGRGLGRGPRRPWGGAADFGAGRAEPGSGRTQVCVTAYTPRLAALARGSKGSRSSGGSRGRLA